MAFNASNVFPWNEFKTETISKVEMVVIPKIYVKYVSITSGAYKGGTAYLIDKKGGSGWHLHPAFIFNGKEATRGLGIATSGTVMDARKMRTTASAKNTGSTIGAANFGWR